MPTYITNIPAATDLISNSQSQLQQNCNAIDSGTTGTGTGFSRNHVTMTDGTNGGLHNEIDFYQNLSDPTITGFVASVYPKTVSAISELFHKNGTGLTQITSGALPIWKGGTTGGTGVITLTNNVSNSINYMALPNGLQWQWGVIDTSALASGDYTVLFVTAGGTNFSNACLQVQLTGSRSSSSNANGLYINTNGTFSANNGLDKTGFNYTIVNVSSGKYKRIYYFAIGY